jgi:hypothetical protein
MAAACAADGVLRPPTLVPAPPEVRNAPEQLSIGGATVRVETYLWRDFQPIAPPDGRGLIAVLRIKDVSGSAVPTLHADSVWIINGDVAWVAAVVQEQPQTDTSHFEVVVREGPKWGPGIDVDVVLLLRDASGQRLPHTGSPSTYSSYRLAKARDSLALPNMRMKLSARGGRLVRKRSVLSAAATGRSLGAIR